MDTKDFNGAGWLLLSPETREKLLREAREAALAELQEFKQAA